MLLISRTIPFPLKTFPFKVTFDGTAGDAHEIWTPVNAAFEFAGLVARADDLIDLNICDDNASTPFAFVQPDTDNYRPSTVLPGVYRANQQGNKLILVDSYGGRVVTVKGIVYGWEVTAEGVYR